MIVVQTPLRISFLGGGTDFEDYYGKEGGAVLTTGINLSVYIIVKERYDDFIYINYSKKEIVDGVNKIEHELAREAMRMTGIEGGIEITTLADVTSEGSGLGSSSSFTVGMLHALYAYKGELPTAQMLAEQACKIEIDILRRPIGKQDQYIAAAFGGFNFIEFSGSNTVVNPLRMKEDVLNELQYRLMLCYTGSRRLSTEIIEDQVGRYTQGAADTVHALNEVKLLALEMKKALLLGRIDDLGGLLHESWSHKKKFSARMTTPEIDEMYEAARKEGVIGGKLLGAGGGGYLLLLSEFDKWHVVAERMEKMGGAVSSVTFEPKGLQTWEVK